MTDSHHNRLLLTVEIAPPARESIARVLDREGSERLLGCIAADLAAVTPRIAGTRLSGAGCLLEPAELLRPGLPAWAALAELTRRARGGQPFSPELFSIGAAGGRLPDDRLAPRPGGPQGLLLGLPLLVESDGPDPELAETLESRLFERGGCRPPVHAELAARCGDGIVHAHILTVTDLMAMFRVQLEQAGLEAPATVLQAMLTGDRGVFPVEDDSGLRIDLDGDGETVAVEHLTPRQWRQTGRTAAEYDTWLRAFRTTCALLRDHRIQIRIGSDRPRARDAANVVTESGEAGRLRDRRIRHETPELGIVAWTVIEDGHLTRYYPLDTDAVEWLRTHLEADDGCERVTARLCYDSRDQLEYVLDEKEEESRSLRQ